MKFASSYEPQNFETDIYAAWEAAGKFLPVNPDKEMAVEALRASISAFQS
jgi:hypothetical protein